MTRKARAKRRDDYVVPYTDPAFRPYATALGQLALAWNGLHEELAILFCTVMGGRFSNHFLAVWHALKVDRAQRDILLAAANCDVPGVHDNYPRLRDEIAWICDRATAVEDARNNALHSPLWGHRRYADVVLIMPGSAFGHVRARNLERKNLLAEFRWCRDAATTLSDFLGEIESAVADHSRPWPGRPHWPERPDASGNRPRRPTRKAKRPRQRRSSQT